MSFTVQASIMICIVREDVATSCCGLASDLSNNFEPLVNRVIVDTQMLYFVNS